MVDKPSQNEEEYFKRLEIEKMKKFEADKAAHMAEQEKVRLRELHYMKCPKCGMDLMEIDYHGIALDRCVTCNGTWFDDGEIERIIDKKQGGVVTTILSFFK